MCQYNFMGGIHWATKSNYENLKTNGVFYALEHLFVLDFLMCKVTKALGNINEEPISQLAITNF